MIQDQTGASTAEQSIARAAALMSEALALLDASGSHFAAMLLDHALNVTIDPQSAGRNDIPVDYAPRSDKAPRPGRSFH